ncbi:hypothetical protein [Croceiramulus getboli]|nr:hypothetical protein P8624_07715 [Flavobacteriaceae bacterium YJPT1-3]
MLKKALLILSLSTLLFSCSQENNFLITDSQVGPLSKDTPVNEIESLFAKDSIVKNDTPQDYISAGDEIQVFDKQGKRLMALSPNDANDPESKIGLIQIYDPRYQTEEGISLESTFKDIQQAYTISRIENLLDAVVILVKDHPVYFTIDKQELPSELQFGTSTTIEATSIPDGAPIKYLMIGW